MARELTPVQQIEQSIMKTYRKQLWRPFTKAITRYDLIQPNDKIAVCISGGKDSMLLAKMMQQLQRISKFPFELVYLCMDPGYKEENRKKIEENAKILDIPLTIFETEIFEITTIVDRNPCYLCARMRRGNLYAKAQSLGCNKIALGHHMDDVIETPLLSMFYGAQLQSMLPKLHSTNFPGMELIRPLYMCREDDIVAWCNYNQLSFIQCACRLTESAKVYEDGNATSKRLEIKLLIKQLKKINPDVDINIFNAIHNVNLNTLPGYKLGKKEFSFMDHYDEESDNEAE